MTSKRPKYAGHVVHAMNRRVDRQTLFKNDEDYSSFRSLLGTAVEKFDLRLLEWVLMPNHVHFLAWPEEKDQFPKFMEWLFGTHAKIWRAENDTVGEGPLYQGYKAFILSSGTKLHRLRNYLAMNPVEGGLVNHPWQWKWGSARRAKYKHFTSDINLSVGPKPIHQNLSQLLYTPWLTSKRDKAKLQKSLEREAPYGNDAWCERMIEKHGLEHTIRKLGRPKKNLDCGVCQNQLSILTE